MTEAVGHTESLHGLREMGIPWGRFWVK
jgi:hypothetical protein